jgi:hypothetical protein
MESDQRGEQKKKGHLAKQWNFVSFFWLCTFAKKGFFKTYWNEPGVNVRVRAAETSEREREKIQQKNQTN